MKTWVFLVLIYICVTTLSNAKKNAIDILHCDLKLENEAIPDLKSAIMVCEKEKDFVSRDMLLKILESEEEHADHLSTQIALVEKVGDENFLQTQISSTSST